MITPKQSRFIDEYIKTSIGSTSYTIAYGVKGKAAAVGASRLLAKDSIKTLLRDRQQNLAEAVDVTPEKVVTEFAKIAFSDHPVMERLRALENLGKHLGLFIEKSIALQIEAELRQGQGQGVVNLKEKLRAALQRTEQARQDIIDISPIKETKELPAPVKEDLQPEPAQLEPDKPIFDETQRLKSKIKLSPIITKPDSPKQTNVFKRMRGLE